jgi:hypothetical protein
MTMTEKDDVKTIRMKIAIQEVISYMMDRVMEKVLVSDPFIHEEFKAKKPLYAALVPSEIFKGSHFERRFVTPFGSVWENLAVVAAREGIGSGQLNYSIKGKIKSERLRRIAEVLNNLEHPTVEYGRFRPNWNEEIKYILAGLGEDIPVQVVCDVYTQFPNNGKKFAFELKSPLPNSDQTKVSKEKILKLYAMNPCQIDDAFFALPYNPYGNREDYSWSFPERWFDMKHDKVVLIGDEFWEKIGGVGTYQAFITAVNEIGPDYKLRIYKEFLGINPPENVDDGYLL